jgi:hypothetical protein
MQFTETERVYVQKGTILSLPTDSHRHGTVAVSVGLRAAAAGSDPGSGQCRQAKPTPPPGAQRGAGMGAVRGWPPPATRHPLPGAKTRPRGRPSPGHRPRLETTTQRPLAAESHRSATGQTGALGRTGALAPSPIGRYAATADGEAAVYRWSGSTTPASVRASPPRQHLDDIGVPVQHSDSIGYRAVGTSPGQSCYRRGHCTRRDGSPKGDELLDREPDGERENGINDLEDTNRGSYLDLVFLLEIEVATPCAERWSGRR